MRNNLDSKLFQRLKLITNISHIKHKKLQLIKKNDYRIEYNEMTTKYRVIKTKQKLYLSLKGTI